MDYRKLGHSDLEASVLSFGTATFGGGTPFFKAWGETGVAEATRLVDIARDAGVNLFDTADQYSDGLSETILGRAIAGRRGDLLIATKAAGRTGPGDDDIGTSRRHLIAACEASLRRLGTDVIDLYQMHWFDGLTPVEETLRGLGDLVAAGKVRYVGCSNFSGWHLMKALAAAGEHDLPRYVTHQAHYSLLSREYEWELMPLAHDQGLSTLVYSALSGGKLSGRIRRGQEAPEGSRTARLKARVEDEMPAAQFFDLMDVLDTVAAEVGSGVAQVAMNWILHRPTVGSVILGARDAAQLVENLRVLDFRLSDDQVLRLDRASARRPIYPYWHQRELTSERNPTPTR